MNAESHAEIFHHSTHLVETCKVALAGLSTSERSADRLGALLFKQTVEDAESLVLLARARLLGSARALMRPQYETFVKACWIVNIAGEGRADGLLADVAQQWPSLDEMIEGLTGKIENQSADSDPSVLVPFKDVYTVLAKPMHAYTHRGGLAINRMYSDNELGERIHSDELVIPTLGSYLGATATIFLLRMVGRVDGAEELAAAMLPVLDRMFKVCRIG